MALILLAIRSTRQRRSQKSSTASMTGSGKSPRNHKESSFPQHDGYATTQAVPPKVAPAPTEIDPPLALPYTDQKRDTYGIPGHILQPEDIRIHLDVGGRQGSSLTSQRPSILPVYWPGQDIGPLFLVGIDSESGHIRRVGLRISIPM